MWVEIVKSHPSSDPRTECAFLMSSVVFLKGPYISFLAKLRTSHPVIFSAKAGNEYAAVPRRHWLLPFDNFLQSLRWRHNDYAGVSNHQPHGCLLNRLFRRKSRKTSKLRVTGLCVGNSPGTGEFPTQMASNAENVSIWWRHHGT